MLPPDQKIAYDAFYDSARHNKLLDPKTTLMLHLAVAMALDCEP